MGWFDSIEHQRWLSNEMQALLAHGQAAYAKTGFGFFDEAGQLDTSRPVDLVITARMTYAYSIGTLLGIPGCRRYCDHGIWALSHCFKDHEYGGWFDGIKHEITDQEASPWDESGTLKHQYGHAFVLLAAAAASVANRPGAFELLRDALENQEQHWFDHETGLVNEGYTRDWSSSVPTRTLNSLLHTIEAYLAAAEATTDAVLIARAERMLQFVSNQARLHSWRAPEYYTEHWRPRLAAKTDDAAQTEHLSSSLVGHDMQLVRLSMQMRGALRSLAKPQPEYLEQMAHGLFEAARQDGWRPDGQPGFAYSVDFDGKAVIATRYQWVACEAICATVSMRRAALDDGAGPGDVEAYSHCYRAWLDYLHDYMLLESGVLRRSLDENNNPTADDAPHCRPDIYHALQALLLPRLPLWPPFASAISRGLLDEPQQPPVDRHTWNVFKRQSAKH